MKIAPRATAKRGPGRPRKILSTTTASSAAKGKGDPKVSKPVNADVWRAIAGGEAAPAGAGPSNPVIKGIPRPIAKTSLNKKPVPKQDDENVPRYAAIWGAIARGEKPSSLNSSGKREAADDDDDGIQPKKRAKGIMWHKDVNAGTGDGKAYRKAYEEGSVARRGKGRGKAEAEPEFEE